jgi:hypothetical protein
VAYKYGISGPWWYGAGATVQVLLFAQVSVRRNDIPIPTQKDCTSWLLSSSSTPRMRILGLKSSMLDGDVRLISFSCSLGL